MLKTIQIIKFMKSKKCNDAQILEELNNIVQNEHSDFFELTSRDIESITEVFDDEAKFNRAWKTATMI